MQGDSHIHGMVRSSGGKAWFDGRRQWALEVAGRKALIESACSWCCRASATTREAAQILVAPNGAELRIRSQLYQQTGGQIGLPTQSDN